MSGRAREVAERFHRDVHRIVVGQDETVRLAFIALLLGGHLLIEGVPGTAKTLLARTIARLIGGTFKRIQFTPDLMPSDIVGTSIYEITTSNFRIKEGPIFANVVLADEVNRAPAKAQAALLEAMEEKQVTLEGDSRPLPRPFLVIATQNPVEYEGTYPLPEGSTSAPLRSTASPWRTRCSSTWFASSRSRGSRPTCCSARAPAPVCTCCAPRRPPPRSRAVTS